MPMARWPPSMPQCRAARPASRPSCSVCRRLAPGKRPPRSTSASFRMRRSRLCVDHAAAASPTGRPAVADDRLAGIDDLLQRAATRRRQSQAAQQRYVRHRARQPTTVPRPPTRRQRVAAQAPRQHLAAARERCECRRAAAQFERMKSHERRPVRGHPAAMSRRARTGAAGDRAVPRHLATRRFSPRISHSAGITAFQWTNSATDRIVPIATE